jgi:hypothetical protein
MKPRGAKSRGAKPYGVKPCECEAGKVQDLMMEGCDGRIEGEGDGNRPKPGMGMQDNLATH